MTLDTLLVLMILGAFVGLVSYFYILLALKGGKTVVKDDPLNEVITALYEYANDYERHTGDSSFRQEIDELVRVYEEGKGK